MIKSVTLYSCTGEMLKSYFQKKKKRTSSKGKNVLRTNGSLYDESNEAFQSCVCVCVCVCWEKEHNI